MKNIISITPQELKELEAKQQIDEMLLQLKELAYKNLKKALKSGCLDDNYFKTGSYLLAKVCLWDLRNEFNPHCKETLKEFQNIEKFL